MFNVPCSMFKVQYSSRINHPYKIFILHSSFFIFILHSCIFNHLTASLAPPIFYPLQNNVSGNSFQKGNELSQP